MHSESQRLQARTWILAVAVLAGTDNLFLDLQLLR